MGLKMFLSYSHQDRHLAGEIKKHFEEFGMECFVAHDNVIPGSEWADEILKNLGESDYFLPLHTGNLIASYWCQQEAGFALCRGIRIIPLLPNEGYATPVGFYAKWQGIKIHSENVRESVRRLLISEGIITDDPDRIEIEKKILIFELSKSWKEAGENIHSLLELESKFTPGDIKRIIEIIKNNGEVLSSFAAQPYVRGFARKHPEFFSQEELKGLLQ